MVVAALEIAIMVSLTVFTRFILMPGVNVGFLFISVQEMKDLDVVAGVLL